MKTLKFGSRKSQLARVQTRMLVEWFEEQGYQTDVHYAASLGDRKRDEGVQARDKQDWIVDLEQQLGAGEIDIAVHSAKDVPVDIAAGTRLLPIFENPGAEDVLIYKDADGSVTNQPKSEWEVGTSSLRRKSQLALCYGIKRVVEFRGNVDTRISKLLESETLDAIVVAAAGLRRLGIVSEENNSLRADLQEQGLSIMVLPPEEFYPGVLQGQLVAQFRDSDTELAEKLISLATDKQRAKFIAQRSCIKKLEADCGSAVGLYERFEGEGRLELNLRVLDKTGSRAIECFLAGNCGENYEDDAENLGTNLAVMALDRGAEVLL